MEKSFKLHPPTMPNFISYGDNQVIKRHDGFRAAPVIPVGSLFRDEAEAYAKLMKNEFMKHWERLNKEYLKNKKD